MGVKPIKMSAIKEAISNLVENRDLSQDFMIQVMNEIMEGRATNAQIGAFLVALRMKGETIEEIAACAKVMTDKAIKIPIKTSGDEVIIDTCGTGGDGLKTFNISTASAFVVAGAGVKVAKHGNRSISSRSGSADCLEALGISLDLSPEQVAKAIEEIGIGFLFAPNLHPAMKYAIGPRKEIGIRSIFNILGPLCNPANANVQLMGVFSEKLVIPLAHVLSKLNKKRAWVVNGPDGMDELGLSGPSKVAELRDDGNVIDFEFDPQSYGFRKREISEIKGGDATENAKIMMDIFEGKEKGAYRDAVILNAGAAIYLADKVSDLGEAFNVAKDVIDSGKALLKLNALRGFKG